MGAANESAESETGGDSPVESNEVLATKTRQFPVPSEPPSNPLSKTFDGPSYKSPLQHTSPRTEPINYRDSTTQSPFVYSRIGDRPYNESASNSKFGPGLSSNAAGSGTVGPQGDSTPQRNSMDKYGLNKGGFGNVKSTLDADANRAATGNI